MTCFDKDFILVSYSVPAQNCLSPKLWLVFWILSIEYAGYKSTALLVVRTFYRSVLHNVFKLDLTHNDKIQVDCEGC